MKNAKCRREPKVMGGTFTRHRWSEKMGGVVCARCRKMRNTNAGTKMLRLTTDRSEGQ